MVMQGFKSFAKRTEVLFDDGINVVIGPNGSGKSNISDALCFVLGRLSIKSMRAAKAKNLIFMGSKYVKPAGEASVELVFDNSDKVFNISSGEIRLKRVVRRNGQSIYKINDETKTRGEVVELLAHAGIDPHGFNIILQGQIQSIVRMHSEERRKIIEEVAGIAIYESRKEKSVRELEKTEERLKEISTVLRERSIYLNKLEEQKQQAEKFKHHESLVRRAKASIFSRKIEGKEKEIESFVESIKKRTEEKDKIKEKSLEIDKKIEDLSEQINKINAHIRKATGVEQETLRNEIANLKAEVEGLRVRKENHESRKEDFEKRIEELEKSIPELEDEIADLRKSSPLMARKREDLQKKKDELAEIENERRILLKAKSELESLKDRISDKEIQYGKVQAEVDQLLKQIESDSEELEHKDSESCKVAIKSLSNNLEENRGKLSQVGKKEVENEKRLGISEAEIRIANENKKNVENIDLCPLCQSKLTKEHVGHVFLDSDRKIEKFGREKEEAEKSLKELGEEKIKLGDEIKELEGKIRTCEVEFERHKNISEKKGLLRQSVEEDKAIKIDLEKLEERRKSLESRVIGLGKIEERHENKILEIEEISARTEKDSNTALVYKEQELEKIRNNIKRGKEDLTESEEIIEEISEDFENKTEKLEEREEQERKLSGEFKKLYEERDKIQKQIQENNLELSELSNSIRQVEDQINSLKVGKAGLDASVESLKIDLQEFKGVELIKGSINVLEERLRKSQDVISRIGGVNLQALEEYDRVKEGYDQVKEKVETLGKEKEEIFKIIEEIDKKKKKTFMKTFKEINDLFTENFSKLTSKGQAYLEIENKEDIFAGGVSIIVRLAKGKYFDVTSLSGGEQTLVALSLLFAIQEHKPYHFYIFDEIDAALDKRNSERLAGLLKQYMKRGQYIVVTHNDAIIIESNLLYGVSMHEGVSKILSLKVD
tara:strand:- start:354 stop:3203 length:2850 start_codon:yes stop_codon:yes gene_type:complete